MRLVPIALLLLMFAACRRDAETVDQRAASPADSVDAECRQRMQAQLDAMARDVFAERETFAKHPARVKLSGPAAEVDLESSRYARLFRTRLREKVAREGVNFAGAYSLVSVGMTGWGDNWYIVDRRSGKVTLFPYYAAFLEFRPDSNLLVMNPRHAIREALDMQDGDCHYLNQQQLTSLRSFYFLWHDGELVRLGPMDLEPPRNTFWDEYLPPPVTTDRKSYTLRPGPYGPETTIVTTFKAPEGKPVSVANCNGAMSLGLQRTEGERWVDAWIAEINGCASPPIVIPPGGQHTATMTPVSRAEIGMKLAPGTFRAAWHGIDLPLEDRVSVPFTIEGR